VHSLEKGGADLPEHARLERAGGCRQPETDVRHRRRRGGIARAHHLEHGLVDTRTHRPAELQRRRRRQRNIDPAPFLGPQIRGVNTVPANQVHHLAVLRKQRHSRSIAALEYTLEVLRQGKTRTFDLVGRIVTAQFGPLDKLLCQRLHRAQNLGGCAKPDHLQCTDRLMQLLAGDPKLAGVELGKIRSARQFGIAHETPQRLARTVQRLA